MDEKNEMDSLDQRICEVFKVRPGDTLPFKSYRRGSRETLAKLMGEWGFKTGAEIGVYRANYSIVLCDAMPGLKLKGIDPWVPFDGGQTVEQMEKYYRISKKRIEYYGGEVIRKTSLEAVKGVPDESLDFVYIDEMHDFDSAILDLIYWSKKVRFGGLVAGHDYSNNYYRYGVIPAVDAYTRAHNIMRWYVTWDPSPSFFWVKRHEHC